MQLHNIPEEAPANVHISLLNTTVTLFDTKGRISTKI